MESVTCLTELSTRQTLDGRRADGRHALLIPSTQQTFVLIWWARLQTPATWMSADSAWGRAEEGVVGWKRVGREDWMLLANIISMAYVCQKMWAVAQCTSEQLYLDELKDGFWRLLNSFPINKGGIWFCGLSTIFSAVPDRRARCVCWLLPVSKWWWTNRLFLRQGWMVVLTSSFVLFWGLTWWCSRVADGWQLLSNQTEEILDQCSPTEIIL